MTSSSTSFPAVARALPCLKARQRPQRRRAAPAADQARSHERRWASARASGARHNLSGSDERKIWKLVVRALSGRRQEDFLSTQQRVAETVSLSPISAVAETLRSISQRRSRRSAAARRGKEGSGSGPAWCIAQPQKRLLCRLARACACPEAMSGLAARASAHAPPCAGL